MKKVYLPVFASIIIILSAYQGLPETLELVFRRINQEVLGNSQAYQTLQKATSTIGHRLSLLGADI